MTGILVVQEANVMMLWAWMLWLAYALETRTLLRFGRGCSSERMLSKHERYCALGMDALVSACSPNTHVIMLSAWMLCLSAAVQHGKTGCRVYAVFRALQTPPVRGSSHAGHIWRGRPSMHFFRVYAPSEPVTIIGFL